eukprot:750543-Hanusia_phi.AAC.2
MARYEVDGYPSLRVLSPDGKILKPFRGGRTADALVDYARKLAGPATVKLNTAKEVKEFIEKHTAAFILFEPESAEVRRWFELSRTHMKEGDEASAFKQEFLKAAEMQSDVASIAIAPGRETSDF